MRALAATAGAVLSRDFGGGGGPVVRWLGGSLTAPHMDPERVQAFFGYRHQFPGIDNLRHIARVGVPVDVRLGGNLTKELTYGNHSSAQKFHVAVWEEAVDDVASGRAIDFPKERHRHRDPCPTARKRCTILSVRRSDAFPKALFASITYRRRCVRNTNTAPTLWSRDTCAVPPTKPKWSLWEKLRTPLLLSPAISAGGPPPQ